MGTQPTVLIVDDTFLMRRLLKTFVSHLECNTLEAENVEEALTVLKKQVPDLVLLDMHLKNETGIKLLEVMRLTHTKTPVIIISAFSDFSPQALRKKYNNILGCLPKPFPGDMLEGLIKRALAFKDKATDIDRIDDYLQNFGEQFILPMEAKNKRRNKTILLVDDDRYAAHLMREGLLLGGFDVYTDLEGLNCLFLLENYDIDLMVLDFMLHDITADEILQVMEERGFQTPILLVSGLQPEIVQKRLGHLGYMVKHIFNKPFPIEQLVEKAGAVT